MRTLTIVLVSACMLLTADGALAAAAKKSAKGPAAKEKGSSPAGSGGQGTPAKPEKAAPLNERVPTMHPLANDHRPLNW